MQIGAQFFTVRAFTKTLDDLSLTLRKVADIGYKTVQLSGNGRNLLITAAKEETDPFDIDEKTADFIDSLYF